MKFPGFIYWPDSFLTNHVLSTGQRLSQ